MLKKAETREEISLKLKSISEETWQIKSQAVLKNLETLSELKETTYLFTFLPKPGEPNILPFLEKWLHDGKKLAAWNGKEIVQITNLNFEKGPHDIPIPIKSTPVNLEEIETAFIPGLAFTKSKDRLGHGGGFFDRFLKDKGFLKIALCLEEQLLPELPTEKHDQKVDLIITEREIIY